MKKWISALLAASVAAALSGCQSAGSGGMTSVTLNEEIGRAHV